MYGTKQAHETSWYQRLPAPSLVLVRRAAGDGRPSLIDVGGGASSLVDCLLEEGFRDLTVLDISARALDQARARLGERARDVGWIEADVTRFEPARRWEIWHDRAAFHFLIDATDRRRYRKALWRALAAGGQAIIGAFAPDGPRRCSGLDIVRYDAEKLGAELGPAFRLEEELSDWHRTPAGREQHFGFYRFRRVA